MDPASGTRWEAAATKVVAAGRPSPHESPRQPSSHAAGPQDICVFIRDAAELKREAVLPDDPADIVRRVRCARRSETLSLYWHRWSSADRVHRKESSSRPASARSLQSP